MHHFYRRRHGGERSDTWVKHTLQRAGLVAKAPSRGKHRRRRERAPLVGMMLHQDGSTHRWVPGQYWDLIITLDDATSEHDSMLFVAEEGAASSFQAMTEVIEGWGLPSSLHPDRGAHDWHTPEAGPRVVTDRVCHYIPLDVSRRKVRSTWRTRDHGTRMGTPSCGPNSRWTWPHRSHRPPFVSFSRCIPRSGSAIREDRR